MAESNITYEIKEHLGIINRSDTGWTKELNVISWNGSNPKYDIRDWDENHERMSRGITLHPGEMRTLVNLYIGANNKKTLEKGSRKEKKVRENVTKPEPVIEETVEECVENNLETEVKEHDEDNATE